jgi:hypothetical protein
MKIEWTGHVICMGKSRSAYRVLVRKPDGKKPLRNHGVDGRMILKCFLKK